MRKSLLFLLNTLLAAATLCVVSCGIDDVDAEDGAIQFELYDTEGTLIEGLQSMKFLFSSYLIVSNHFFSLFF